MDADVEQMLCDALAGLALKRAGLDDERERMYQEITASESYDQALQVILRYAEAE